ncbi:MAG: alpha/beta fold hydrolase, partial [Acidobacteriota bacterium]
MSRRLPLATSTIVAAVLAAAALVTAFAPAVDADPRNGPDAALAVDIAFAEAFTDPAAPLIETLRRATPSKSLGALDAVYTVEHQVPIGDGRTLFVTESFTVRSLFQWPRRAVLFLSGSAFRGDHWSIPVDGYDGTAMAARRGFFAYTVDYLGVGDSFRPADGAAVTFEANRDATHRLLRLIRGFRLVPKVDLVGAGYGGSLATQLAVDGRRVRSVVMSAML